MRTLPVVLCLLTFGLAPALAQTPARPEATPKVDPAIDAAQRAFDALPEADRKAIQNDLIWASGFNATVSGSFGPRTFESIRHFERTIKSGVDGILDPAERKALVEAASKARLAVKFELVTDKATGAALGLPLALLPKREALPIGTIWSSKDEALFIRTGLSPGSVSDLPRAFEGTLSIDAPGRKVTYKLLRPDFFVVSGEVGPRTFYTRTAPGNGHLVSYTITYPTARQKEFERVMIALANNFHPIASATPQTAAAPPSNPNPPAATPVAQAGTQPAGLILTGSVIAPGRIATAALAAACPDLRVNGKPAKLTGAVSPAGIVLLDADTGRAPPLSIASADTAGPALLIGYVHAGGKPVLSVSSATLLPGAGGKPGRMEAPLHAEGGGSLVFDRSGNLAGMAMSPRQAPRLIAGITPAVSHPMAGAKDLFAAAGLTSAAPATAVLSAGALAARVAPSLVAVDCGQPVPLPK